MQKGGAAAEVANDEKGFFDGMVFVGGEENIIEPEEEPVHHLSERPDDVEQEQECYSFFCELGGGVL